MLFSINLITHKNIQLKTNIKSIYLDTKVYLRPEKNIIMRSVSVKIAQVGPNLYKIVLIFMSPNKFIIKIYSMTHLMILISHHEC